MNVQPISGKSLAAFGFPKISYSKSKLQILEEKEQQLLKQFNHRESI